MNRVESLLEELIQEQRMTRQLLERQVAPVIIEEYRQLLTADPETVKRHNKDVLARAKAKLKMRGGAA